MSRIGPTIAIKGEVRSAEPLTIEGRIEGPIVSDDAEVVIGKTGQVVGDVVARDVTVYGRVSGQLVATDIVDIRPEATVRGRVVSKRLALGDGARFDGRVEPQHLEAALAVARFRGGRTPL
jgi:cytoskeletal protein CcmA (bactofilin family)